MKTLDFRSPTGNPLEDATPSNGVRLSSGYVEEKKPWPRARELVDDIKGVVRDGKASEEFFMECGWDSRYSYISRSREKFVGKKMSK